ncbi:hypothetical protein SAMN04488511_102307 [Pedobacter suwonensis]|uniref:HEPN AbiU2-like domain-containing protein n=1 Tax=Pedobacter suwonensis TaxID=332999 RepID=A0A1I0SPD3_9SPHI|nr:hypothetical protein [Pedobacter suwonensis]SFA41368.1 hypothetical protein SAMN04488511_102307 [Pedobacter suwonensis]
MLSEKLKVDFASMRVEILDLNVLAYFYVRKLNRLAHIIKTTTREYLLEEFTALRYMENGIILHLTNLDDDSSNFSFRTASAAFKRSTRDQKAQTQIHETLKTFRKNLNDVKVAHRNKRIAHLNYEKDLRFDEFLDFEKVLLPLINEANTIADEFWGEKINAKFRLGSLEGHIDFRRTPDDLKVDVNKFDGFF